MNIFYNFDNKNWFINSMNLSKSILSSFVVIYDCRKLEISSSKLGKLSTLGIN